ncbi:MAG: carbon-nitrogen hydrolase family protein [Desulfobulbia bacterium]
MKINRNFRTAMIQLRSGRNVESNIENATELISVASRNGAEYVLTPENTDIMELRSKILFEKIQTEQENAGLKEFLELSKELGIWLHVGSMAIKFSETKIANRSYLINPEGVIAASYDKIHMFDVELPGGERFRESKNYQSGEQAPVTKLPWGSIGLSICYDLRFPQLFRQLAQSGAEIIAVPSAFTYQTGKAHWHVLLRARAIENGCFIIAAAQSGQHESGRKTFGHSLIINPWGQIIAEAGNEPGIIYGDIDLDQVTNVRQKIPSLEHDREFETNIVEESKDIREAS